MAKPPCSNRSFMVYQPTSDLRLTPRCRPTSRYNSWAPCWCCKSPCGSSPSRYWGDHHPPCARSDRSLDPPQRGGSDQNLRSCLRKTSKGGGVGFKIWKWLEFHHMFDGFLSTRWIFFRENDVKLGRNTGEISPKIGGPTLTWDASENYQLCRPIFFCVDFSSWLSLSGTHFRICLTHTKICSKSIGGIHPITNVSVTVGYSTLVIPVPFCRNITAIQDMFRCTELSMPWPGWFWPTDPRPWCHVKVCINQAVRGYPFPPAAVGGNEWKWMPRKHQWKTAGFMLKPIPSLSIFSFWSFQLVTKDVSNTMDDFPMNISM